jgi:ubiquitin-conjugating enzyme (huntingtin interacting protein 2)
VVSLLSCISRVPVACSPCEPQDIVIPESYPFQPVKMKFLTKIYHPNVSSASGAICLDILKDAWSPVLTLKSTLISLQSLLCSPEPNDPQDAEVAKHYLTSKSSFEETARYWTMVYAGGPGKPGDAGKKQDEIAMAGLEKAHVDQFEALGFDRGKVVCLLKPFCAPFELICLFLDRCSSKVKL